MGPDSLDAFRDDILGELPSEPEAENTEDGDTETETGADEEEG